MADLTVLAFGAGVQSTALLILACQRDERLLKATGGVNISHAIFADPGSEGQDTYDHVQRMRLYAMEHGIDVITSQKHVTKTLHDAIREDPRFASIPAYCRNPDGSKGHLMRNCTRDYKIRPIATAMRRLLGTKRVTWQRVDVWLGISLDEIIRIKPSGFTWQTRKHPLVDMGWRRDHCDAYNKRMGFENVPKSACVYCPYHNDRHWRELKKKGGKDWQEAVDMDYLLRRLDGRGGIKSTPYLHRSLVPLDQADLGESQMDLFDFFGNECEGMCGI